MLTYQAARPAFRRASSCDGELPSQSALIASQKLILCEELKVAGWKTTASMCLLLISRVRYPFAKLLEGT